jgi:hypothetical protein
VRARVAAHLLTGSGVEGTRARATELLFLGAALLNLYLQVGNAGPHYNDHILLILLNKINGQMYHTNTRTRAFTTAGAYHLPRPLCLAQPPTLSPLLPHHTHPHSPHSPQANYTGPAPDPTTLAAVAARLHPTLTAAAGKEDDASASASTTNKAFTLLEADGESPYPYALIPQALAASRLLLHLLTLPQHAAWLAPTPLALDEQGQPTLAPAATTTTTTTTTTITLLRRASLLLLQEKEEEEMGGTARVWALRALVTHRRALPGRRLTTALWAEAAALGGPVSPLTVEVGGVGVW